MLFGVFVTFSLNLLLGMMLGHVLSLQVFHRLHHVSVAFQEHNPAKLLDTHGAPPG